MKTLSALLIGAFMLVGANSVIALEGGASADSPRMDASAIAAVQHQVQEYRADDGKNKCFTAPQSSGVGSSLEITCANTDASDRMDNYSFPEIINTPN